MEERNEGAGKTEIIETEQLLLKTRLFLYGLESGSAVHERIQGFASELEAKLAQLGNDVWLFQREIYS